MKKRTLGKKISLSILIIVIIISAILMLISWLFRALPEHKRNTSTSDIRLSVDMSSNQSCPMRRTPIIRTYTKEEFDNFDERKLNKIEEMLNGSLEGDIPGLIMENGIAILKVSFEKMDKNNKEETISKIIPDEIPKIKISVRDSLYSRDREELKEINDSFIKSGKEGIYIYEIKKYLNEANILEEDIYDIESSVLFNQAMYIEVTYEINKESYVSIFATQATEYRD